MKTINKIFSVALSLFLVMVIFPQSLILGMECNGLSTQEVEKNSDVSIFNIDGEMPQVLGDNERLSKHVKRLYDSEDMYSIVFKNSDQTETKYVFNEPIKYVDDNGNVKDKSTELSYTDGAYINKENDVKLVLPQNLLKGISLKYEEFAITMVPKQICKEIKDIEKIGTDTVLYKNAFSNGIDISYTSTFSGVKCNIILEKPIEKYDYEFIAYTDGYTITYSKEGKLVVLNNEDTEIAIFSDIIVYDNSGKQCIGKISVETIIDKKEYLITISVDNEFL